jgi:carboxyl-terminal processing protease
MGKDKLVAAFPEQGAVNGMIEALNDAHSRYYSPVEKKLEQENLEGNYYGIGVLYYLDENKKLIIDNIVESSPAQKAGLQVGDVILAVNGVSTTGMKEETANTIISDESQKKVDFSIERGSSSTPLAITVNKGTVNIISVTSQMVQDIACIRISGFTLDTDSELQEALKSLDKAAVKGIVLDLRDNSEGSFVSVLEIASRFLDKGPVMQVKDNEGHTDILDPDNLFKNEPTVKELTLPMVVLPMAVLVNEGTAGCSEALCGALQDRGRAKIAGTVTRGNGSQIAFFDLRDGSSICLAIEYILTPNGKEIEGKGITPDFTITQTGEAAVLWAVDFLHSNQQN